MPSSDASRYERVPADARRQILTLGTTGKRWTMREVNRVWRDRQAYEGVARLVDEDDAAGGWLYLPQGVVADE